MCPYDSCRLLAINLYSYVVNPFTKEAYFDFDLFRKHVGLAQRMMDDIIDLEMEKIDKIIEKIKSDPETDEVKCTELNLWYKIQKRTLQGRRTGVGTTAEGDMIAALWNRRGYRFFRKSTSLVGTCGLSFIGFDGKRAWGFLDFRCR